MQAVEELRRRIDAVDDEIVAALNRRFELAGEMRELKKREGLAARDEAREQEIFRRVLEKTPAAERDTVFSIYERIFGGSRGTIETIARGVAIRDGKVLLCRAKGGRTTYLPGGHIEFGETGRQALVREMQEEMGVDATAGALLGVVENQFRQHGRPHAEINLVYELAVPAGTAAVAREDWIEFEWRDLDDLDAAKLLPETIRELVLNPRNQIL